jgi:catechol 2,3-dioxygenase-like lactoylglutathione lyase family enzyme
MSNIENLKKRAKALVRLHRERSYHLACVARETLPKFAAMSDQEILAAEFKLSDAQALVARHEGFEDWSALMVKADNAPSRNRTVTAAPAMLFAVPILYVADVRRALACYAGILGFDILQTSGDPPFYAEVRRGNARLGLRLVHGHAIDPAVRASEAMLVQTSIRVGSAKMLYLEYLVAGATFNEALTRDPWGPQYFIVEDPDGNLILFGEEGPNAPKE